MMEFIENMFQAVKTLAQLALVFILAFYILCSLVFLLIACIIDLIPNLLLLLLPSDWNIFGYILNLILSIPAIIVCAFISFFCWKFGEEENSIPIKHFGGTGWFITLILVLLAVGGANLNHFIQFSPYHMWDRHVVSTTIFEDKSIKDKGVNSFHKESEYLFHRPGWDPNHKWLLDYDHGNDDTPPPPDYVLDGKPSPDTIVIRDEPTLIIKLEETKKPSPLSEDPLKNDGFTVKD